MWHAGLIGPLVNGADNESLRISEVPGSFIIDKVAKIRQLMAGVDNLKLGSVVGADRRGRIRKQRLVRLEHTR